MAQVFRVERNKNFTVMSNHHFKNKDLSLKAKGLFNLLWCDTNAPMAIQPA